MRLCVLTTVLSCLAVPILGTMRSYDSIDCTGPYIIHHQDDRRCIDMTKVISNRLEEDDRGWKFYPTFDCSGSVFYIARPLLVETLRRKDDCVVDNRNYPFVAQSARPLHPHSH
ncbi:hypothetical protein [Absidia glauca]|uniref:Uncharacterized protein n=1 Tax=Absidia glauca TaxID=4829 RepID=A0A163J368_ABSGL|nr:hypothetical protein [Absidia glauca]